MVKLKEPKLSKSDKKSINQLANIFNWLKNEEVYIDMDAYKNSYCKQFLEILKNQIEFSKVYKDEEYIRKLKDSLKYFDTFFTKNIKKDEIESKTKIQLKEKRDELKKKFKENFKNFSLESLFNEAKEDIEVEIKNYKEKAKQMLKEEKSVEEIQNIVSNSINEILQKMDKDLNEAIEEFNRETQIIINDIKDMQFLFNQLELNKNEQFQNNFDQLVNSGQGIYFKKEENAGSFSTFVKSVWSSIKYFFKSMKSTELAVIGKIDDLRYDTIENLNEKERIMKIKFRDEKIKLKANFYAILAMAFTDLSIIEEKEWNESKEQYNKAKKFLLPDEEDKEQKEEEKVEEKKEEKSEEKKEEKKEEKIEEKTEEKTEEKKEEKKEETKEEKKEETKEEKKEETKEEKNSDKIEDSKESQKK